MHTASVRVTLPDEAAATAVLAALEPEAAEGPEGSTTRLSCLGSSLHAEIEAGDVSALRAALNSVVRLLDAATRTI